MKSIIYLFAIILIVLSLNSCVDHEDVGSIYGIVSDKETGEFVTEATVNLYPTNETRTTKKYGNYKFEDLSCGSYSLIVYKDGYYTFVDDNVIEVEGGSDVRYDVKIEKKPDVPVDPENPENPEEPQDPQEPNDPEEPEDPENPQEPDEPEEPEEPENPDDNTQDNYGVNITVSGVTFTMIEVEEGTYMMGGDGGIGSNIDETPRHSVTLSAYFIGETEVTQELWMAVMGNSGPSIYVGDKMPVHNISWEQCIEFIDRLNEKTGKTFRLPTEAEWEYAARGGKMSKGYKYSGSDNAANVAWHSDNVDKPQNVKSKTPNELGIYDMSGNVYEFCSDWYAGYNSSAQTNPTGPDYGSDKVLRGGSFYHSEADCRVANRFSSKPAISNNYNGLRLVME